MLDRAVGRMRIFAKRRDFEAFEEVIAQAKERGPAADAPTLAAARANSANGSRTGGAAPIGDSRRAVWQDVVAGANREAPGAGCHWHLASAFLPLVAAGSKQHPLYDLILMKRYGIRRAVMRAFHISSQGRTLQTGDAMCGGESRSGLSWSCETTSTGRRSTGGTPVAPGDSSSRYFERSIPRA